MFVNVYRQILSRHLDEWCITFVCLGVEHYTDLLVKIVLLRWNIMVYSVMVWHYRSTRDFILPVSLAIVYIVGSQYCKVLKDQEAQSLISLVSPGGRKSFFKRDSFLSFSFSSSILTCPPSSSCYLYSRWRRPACDHWCCLKVLLTSLKFDSLCFPWFFLFVSL